MNTVWFCTAVLLILLLIGLMRVGAVVEYSEAGLTVRLRVGPFQITVFPIRERRKTGKKHSPAEKKKKKESPMVKGGGLELLQEGLPLVLKTANHLRKKLRVDVLRMVLTVSAPDPGDAAMLYGQANAWMASLWGPITEAFHVKDANARIQINFDAERPMVYLYASLSLHAGQLAAFAAVLVVKVLGILIRNRRQQSQQLTQRKAVNNGTKSSN